MAADPKKIAALIVAKGAPSMEGPDADGPETDQPEDNDEGQSAAASEMLDAVQKQDVQALVTALKSFISMC